MYSRVAISALEDPVGDRGRHLAFPRRQRGQPLPCLLPAGGGIGVAGDQVDEAAGYRGEGVPSPACTESIARTMSAGGEFLEEEARGSRLQGSQH